MSEDSPRFWFDLDSRRSLFRKVYSQQYITKDEINRVLEAETASHNGPRMLPILIAAHREWSAHIFLQSKRLIGWTSPVPPSSAGMICTGGSGKMRWWISDLDSAIRGTRYRMRSTTRYWRRR